MQARRSFMSTSFGSRWHWPQPFVDSLILREKFWSESRICFLPQACSPTIALGETRRKENYWERFCTAARPREVTQDQSNKSGRSEAGDFEGFSFLKRLVEDNNGKGNSQSNGCSVRSRVAQIDGAHKLSRKRRTTRETVAILILRLHQGLSINWYKYVCVLRECFKHKDLESVKQVHDCVKKSGLEQNRYVANDLLKCYVGCGKLHEARALFNRFINKNIVSWSIMIGGYAEQDQAGDAFQLYQQMRNEGVQLDAVIYLSALKACASPAALKWGKDIHAHIIHDGFQADVRVGSALVNMYSKCGCIDEARLVFDALEERNLISWNAMINGLAQHGLGHEAVSCFQQMQRKGVVPNATTFLCILNSNACEGALAWVKEVHGDAVRLGLNNDLRVSTALVNMYAKCGSVDDAKMVFDRMEERNLISWNAMIGGLAQNDLGYEAFSLFLQMQREGYQPDWFTYASILNPRSSRGALDWVKEVHSHATKAGLDVDLRVGNELVHMYAKIGSISDARQVFDKMMDRDVLSWNVMIGGLANHGHGREALQRFKEMKLNGVRPSGSSFVAVLSACSHAGLVAEGRFQLESMTRVYGIEPTLEHYTCMADILGRAGHLEEAKLFILNMPMNPSAVTWTAFLGACRIFNNIKLAEFAAKECLKLEPEDPASYVLLSNIYAAIGDWDQVSSIRCIMQMKGIRKDPGRCWIEIDNKIHYFYAGDTSHPEINEIYAKLNTLSKRLKAEGYIPDTRLVLRDIDEEEREREVCSHGEKLALAYGLMHVNRGKPIRIYQNIRMCSDCHTATKMISKITGREVVARDVKRFHHFKDGVCSCGDYW